MVQFRPFTNYSVVYISRHPGRYRVASNREWRSVFVRYPVFLPISRVRSLDRNLNRSRCRRMIFAKSLCRAIRPLSCSRGGIGAAFLAVRFPGVKERFSAGRGFILQQLRASFLAIGAWCILLGESNRAPALLSIPPLNFADLLLLPARSNIYARKCSDCTTIARKLLNLACAH